MPRHKRKGETAHRSGVDRRIGDVDGFSTAIAFVGDTDMVTIVPERHTAGWRMGLTYFDLPFEEPPFTVSMLWHPRMDADQAHRWLRGCVRKVCDPAL